MDEATLHFIANHLMDIHEDLKKRILSIKGRKNNFTIISDKGNVMVEELSPLIGIIKTIHMVTGTRVEVQSESIPPLASAYPNAPQN